MPKSDNPETQAAMDEATGAADATRFEYDGESYEVPADRINDIDVREHLESSNMTLFARELLGPAQWRRFKSKPRTYTDAVSIANAWSAAAGSGK